MKGGGRLESLSRHCRAVCLSSLRQQIPVRQRVAFAREELGQQVKHSPFLAKWNLVFTPQGVQHIRLDDVHERQKRHPTWRLDVEDGPEVTLAQRHLPCLAA